MVNAQSKKQDTRQSEGEKTGKATGMVAAPKDDTKAPPAPVLQQDKPDMSKEHIRKAIAQGQAILKEGKSKADAARAIYALLKDENRDVVIEAFIQGATITQKGAPTYYYNVSRKFKKDQAKAEKEKPQS